MIVDVLLEANPIYKFQDRVFDSEKYTLTTDMILSNIELSKNPELKKSQDILKQIKCRELYRIIDHKLIKDKKIIPKVTSLVS